MLRHLLLFASGLAVVSGARLVAAGPDAPERPDNAAPALAAHIAAPDAPVPADPAACAELQAAVLDRLDAVQAEVDEMEALRTLLTGEPIPWPDDAPAHVREDAVRAVFQAAAERVGDGLVLEELRCEEYPCLGIFEKLEDDTPPNYTSGTWFTAFEEALDGVDLPEPSHVRVLSAWRGGPEDNHHMAITLSDVEIAGDLWWRLHHRTRDADAETSSW